MLMETTCKGLNGRDTRENLEKIVSRMISCEDAPDKDDSRVSEYGGQLANSG